MIRRDTQIPIRLLEELHAEIIYVWCQLECNEICLWVCNTKLPTFNNRNKRIFECIGGHSCTAGWWNATLWSAEICWVPVTQRVSKRHLFFFIPFCKDKKVDGVVPLLRGAITFSAVYSFTWPPFPDGPVS